jgi:SAM-dependent methyltransferase
MIEIPPPPPELARYVGTRSDGDPVALYLEQAEALSRILVSVFPADLDLDGERVLDFGCGSGRFLRHLINAGTGATFEGCDIDAPSIEWLQRHLPAPHEVFLSDPEPPLRRPDGHYRLIYATSVFTHLTHNWAPWFCELHRLLANDGILIATVIGASLGGLFGEDPWDDERIGMLVLGPGNPWHAGGPMVLHSEWWVRAHWGRAFEILAFEAGERVGFGQGVVVMRKRDTTATPELLEAIEIGEPREISALTHALGRAHDESIKLNKQHDEYAEAYIREASLHKELQHEVDRLQELLYDATAQLVEARRARTAARIVVRAAGARARMLARRVKLRQRA